MQFFNSFDKYGLLAKLFHWITFIVLLVQVPFGFYLVGLEFSDQRIELENIHISFKINIISRVDLTFSPSHQTITRLGYPSTLFFDDVI